jgi:type I restriction enzyme R subunit
MAQASDNQHQSGSELPGGALMVSTNFEFLRDVAPLLADTAAFAEKYCHSDPYGAALKLRNFTEALVDDMYHRLRFPRPYNAHLHDLLLESSFIRTTPRVIRNHFDLLRKLGNQGAHPNAKGPRLSPDEVVLGLQDAFTVARWAFLTYLGGNVAAVPASFKEPPPESTKSALKKEKKELLEAARLREKQLEEALAAQKAALEKAAKAEAALAEAERLKALTDAELNNLQAKGQAVADNVLHLNEDETRKRLIDADLVTAGWDVTDQEQVRIEFPVSGLPKGAGTGGKSGEGRADYVLWDDNGKPLAVIEAKRASIDAEKGRTQASLYADALESAYGQRPVIFYTNGPEIFLWDDRAHGEGRNGYPPRKVYGYYSKGSLQTLLFRRTEKVDPTTIAINPEVAGRIYQVEAVKRVMERFVDNHRRVLIVQATGTGKTRVAVSLCDVLARAKWSKRVLFLCDRKELRKQALKAFSEYLPSEPRVEVTKEAAGDQVSRIFVGTYPGMMGIYESFDVGFFDLIIADESHRSIYNKYRDLFEYFDCLQIGLTATPVKFVERNTYKLFKCEDQDPTFNYEYDDAVKEGYLVPFEVVRVTTGFLREGIKYSQMSDEQKRELEAQLANAESVEYESTQVDKQIFNRDTSRQILENLMENGIRDATRAQPGKSIIFARSHDHAQHLEKLFNELYPQLGGTFARLIDSQEPNAEALIDDFKDPTNKLTIAISVDMLDTGLDVPEVVNLVFAKPVKSYVKFWQMIGRGTRLAPVPGRDSSRLFAPGKKKENFRIFDHWENFKFFDESYREVEPSQTKSLQQKLLEARVELLEEAHNALDEELVDDTRDLILAQLNALRETNAIPVREHWKELEQLAAPETIRSFHATTKVALLTVAAPLMHLLAVRGEESAYKFDLTMTRLQTARLRKTPDFDDLRAHIEDDVSNLPKTLNQVKAKAATIKQVGQPAYWDAVTPGMLSDVRRDLRGLMKYRQSDKGVLKASPVEVDVADGNLRSEAYRVRLTGLELTQYRNRVRKALEEHFQEHLVYRKIRSNIRVQDADLEKLALEVLAVDAQADLHRLLDAEKEHFQGQLYFALKSVVGLDREAVDKTFQKFVTEFPKLSSRQVQFLGLIKNHICQHGLITIDQLYEGQFTQFEAESVDGVFPETQMVDALLGIVSTFSPDNVQSERSA